LSGPQLIEQRLGLFQIERGKALSEPTVDRSELAFPRFEGFLRVATRFFALAMAISCELCRRSGNARLRSDRRHGFDLDQEIWTV
jgi:hypothetical protein